MFAAPIANCCPVLIQDPAIYHNLVLNNTNFYLQCDGMADLDCIQHSSPPARNTMPMLTNFFSICIQNLK